MKTPKVVCFGEVLFDKLPSGKKIGGAPLNVGLRMKSLGCDVNLISAIGNDSDGSDIIEHLKKTGIPTDLVQINSDYPTGEALVKLDAKGNASYEIKYPVSWDHIIPDEKASQIVAASDVFIYGTLSNRNKISRDTLISLLNLAPYSVLDLNLRPPHYETSTLKQLMTEANLIKFSDDEFEEISKLYKTCQDTIEKRIEYISQLTQTESICITMGANGAILYHNKNYYYCKGYPIKVIDTVGAGDSFLAALTTKLVTENNPQFALNFACAVGALVAQNEGSNPTLKPETIKNIMKL